MVLPFLTGFNKNSILLFFLLTTLTVSCKKSQSDAHAIASSDTTITPLEGELPPDDTTGLFPPLPEPEAGDWLSVHEEPGQSFEQFSGGPRNHLDSGHTIIYLQPIWDFDYGNGPPIHYLKTFAECYFGLEVKIRPTLHPTRLQVAKRINYSTQAPQAHAGDILEYLMRKIPHDAYCVLGITMQDLYPDPSWNFVFGYATYEERTGVFSFARYAPSFYNKGQDDNQKQMLLRSCKILAHETGHMFGMAHCTYYHCVMNGCNHLLESDAQPIHLCPVCLKKLQHAVSFNTAKRYADLERFYRLCGLTDEAKWIANRLHHYFEEIQNR